VVLATDWQQFLELDPDALRAAMRGDLLLDGRNLLPTAPFAKAGIRIEGFGW
jgi:UDP-glucose 6-dehydrogenase